MQNFLRLLLGLGSFYVGSVNALEQTPLSAAVKDSSGVRLLGDLEEWFKSLPVVSVDGFETDSDASPLPPPPLASAAIIRSCRDIICPICPSGAYYFGKYTDGQLAYLRSKGHFGYFPVCDNCFPDAAMRDYLHESARKEIDAAEERANKQPLVTPDEHARAMTWAGAYWEEHHKLSGKK